MTIVTLSELLESGVHFGHQARRWNPKMFPYIYAERNGIHILDLVQSAHLLTNACNHVRKASQEGKQFLFVGTKRQAAGVIQQEATRCGAHYVNQRWLGGTLTNWFTIKTRIEYLKDLEHQEENNYFEQLPKKEAAYKRRELEKLRKNLNGIKEMQSLPNVVIIVDQKRETTAIQECIKLGIEVVSLLDTNCNPDLADICIPANDDSIRSVKLILGKLANSIYEGSKNEIKSEDKAYQK
jgi:small subunit ribosomal protein S2